MPPRPELRPSARPALRNRLAVRLSHILEMPEDEVSRLARGIEQDPLFQKLLRAESPEWKVFSRHRFPGTRIAPGAVSMDERVIPEPSDGKDISKVVSDHESLLPVLRRMGRETFEKAFLYDEGEKTPSCLARELGLDLETVERIRRFVEEALLDPALFQRKAPAGGPAATAAPLPLARYFSHSSGELEILFSSPFMARGLYRIDQERLRSLKSSDRLTSLEKNKLRETLRVLEMINARKNLIFRILHFLPRWQKGFFQNGDPQALGALTQKKGAEELGVTPGAFCRALQGRSVEMPQGTTFALCDLFPSTKDVQKRRIADLFGRHPESSDREIQALAAEELGIILSRRSINVYRREIEGSETRRRGQPRPG